MSTRLSESFARELRWSPEKTEALPGQCRGDLLGAWGQNLRRHFGSDAVASVRAELSPALAAIPETLTDKHWVPVAAQVRITEAIIDAHLDGDATRLYPLLLEDTRRGTGRIRLAVLRRLGFRRVLQMAPRSHVKVYNCGTVSVDIHARAATLRFTGAALFACPSWRLLQAYAQRVVGQLAGENVEATVLVSESDGGSCAVHLRW